MLTIYTDGSCRKDGTGAWAAKLMWDGQEKIISGTAQDTTNQRMEMTAVIRALEAVKRPAPTTIYSDSAYIVNCMHQRWYERWRENGWQTSNKKKVKNQDLWASILQLTTDYAIYFVHIRGHAGNPHNEEVDRVARKLSAGKTG